MNKKINQISWKILVSSCLLWLKTRYDWKSKPHVKLIEFLKTKDVIFYCPEQWWGLPTPRTPAEIEFWKTAKDVLDWNGKIIDKNWKDATKEFVKWAYYTLEICKKFDVKYVILKSKSPSCWYKKTHDWTFSWNLIQGNWITAELLVQNNIIIFTEEDF